MELVKTDEECCIPITEMKVGQVGQIISDQWTNTIILKTTKNIVNLDKDIGIEWFASQINSTHKVKILPKGALLRI